MQGGHLKGATFSWDQLWARHSFEPSACFLERSRLDDAGLAGVLNWLLATLSPNEVAADFAPFTPEEVADARRAPLPEPQATRARMVADLQAMGIIARDEDGIGLSPERRRQADP